MELNNNKTTLIILFLLLLSFSIGNAQEKRIRIRMPKIHKKEHPKTINSEAVKALNLGAPLKPSTSTHVSAYDVDALTDELLKRQRLEKADSTGVRPLLGYSAFRGFYESNKTGRKITVDPSWLMPKDFFINLKTDRITLTSSILATMKRFPATRPKINGFRFGMENILESIFWKKAPDHWTAYSKNSIPMSTLQNLPTLMPDSLVRLRMIVSTGIDSMIRNSNKKYKIVYLFCADNSKQKDNFKRITSYVSNHKDLYYFIPISDIRKVAPVALYLKRQGYFDNAYIVDRPEGIMRSLAKMSDMKKSSASPTFFVLDSQNKVVAVGNDSSFNNSELDSTLSGLK